MFIKIYKYVKNLLFIFNNTNSINKAKIDNVGCENAVHNDIVKLFYYTGCRNLGDSLNEDIMLYFGVNYQLVSFDKSNLMAIGSILQNIITDARPEKATYYDSIDIWGSGFIEESKAEIEYL